MAYTIEHEAELITKAQADCERSKMELIRRHEAMIVKLAKKHAKRIEPDDALQIGNMALLEAIPKFDTSRGLWFNTYCRHRIAERLRVANNMAYPVKLGDKQSPARDAAHVMDARSKLQAQGLEPTSTAVAKAMGLTDAKYATVLARARLYSDNAFVAIEGDFDIADEPSDAELNLEFDRARQLLSDAADCLTPRERSILMQRTAANDEPATLGDLSEELGVSRERVRQIENALMAKLENRFTKMGLSVDIKPATRKAA